MLGAKYSNNITMLYIQCSVGAHSRGRHSTHRSVHPVRPPTVRAVSFHPLPARPADPLREKSENVFHGPSKPPPAAAADVQLEAYSPAQNAAADNADGLIASPLTSPRGDTPKR